LETAILKEGILFWKILGSGEYMKKLLMLLLLALLTSCVTYYHPETALEDGVYYAEDDPKYVVYQGGYPGFAYYPWASLDYFYMGYSPYPVYPYYTGFPFGIVYSYYPYGYWGNYRGYCRHDVVCGGSPHQRYAGNERGDRQARDNEASDNEASDDEYRGDDLDSMNPVASGTGRPYHSYVSTMPAGYSGNRGMVIRSSEATKIEKSRVQPVQSDTSSNGIIVTAVPSLSTTTPVAASSSGAAGTRVVSERPAQTLGGGSSHPSRSSSSSHPSRSSATSRSRPSSGNSNRSRSSARSSSSRSSKGNRSVPREKRD
jgi:hypothetical protein